MLSYRRRTLRAVLALANVLLVLLVLLRLFFVLLLPQFSLRRIVVSGDLAISKDFFYRLLLVDGERVNVAALDPEWLEQRLRRYALVKEAKVVKVYPDTLRISLKQRRPVAVILLPGEEGMTPMVVDSEGVLFRLNNLPDTNLPVLSGLYAARGESRQRLPRVMLPFLQRLEVLQQDEAEFFRVISEIVIAFTDDGLIADLVLTSYPTRVRIDERLDGRTMRAALVALETLQRGKIHTPLIDMRTTSIVYVSEGT